MGEEKAFQTEGTACENTPNTRRKRVHLIAQILSNHGCKHRLARDTRI